MSAPDPYADLDALTREYFARPDVAAQTAAEMLAARRAAENPEPPPVSVVPIPVFPAPGFARYHCQRGCGWWHDEPTDPGPTNLIFSPAQDGADLGAMISANAEARALVYQARVEEAITAHYGEAH